MACPGGRLNVGTVMSDMQSPPELIRNELLDSDGKYRLLTENTSDVVWLLNMNDFSFEYISPAIERLRGLTVDEAMQETLQDSMTPESLARVQRRVAEAMEYLKTHPDEPFNVIEEVQQPCKDGSLIWVEVSTRYTCTPDGTLYIIGVSRNIQDRKIAEEKLNAALAGMEELNDELTQANEELSIVNRKLEKTNAEFARVNASLEEANAAAERYTEELTTTNEELADINVELEQANAEKNRFFSIISHDLRSPIATMVGFAELLGSMPAVKQEPDVAEYTRHILDTGRNAMDLLENMVTWARASSGRLTPSFEQADLAETLRDVVDFHSPIAARKQIELHLNATEKVCVSGDPSMLRTLFGNLISNAIKFSHVGGRVDLTLGHEHGMAWVEVADNGMGMPAAIVNDLFRIDKKTGREGTLKEPSSGLGLLVCKEFCELHNGKIQVESEPGKGSIFTVRLPQYRA